MRIWRKKSVKHLINSLISFNKKSTHCQDYLYGLLSYSGGSAICSNLRFLAVYERKLAGLLMPSSSPHHT